MKNGCTNPFSQFCSNCVCERHSGCLYIVSFNHNLSPKQSLLVLLLLMLKNYIDINTMTFGNYIFLWFPQLSIFSRPYMTAPAVMNCRQTKLSEPEHQPNHTLMHAKHSRLKVFSYSSHYERKPKIKSFYKVFNWYWYCCNW